MPSITSSPGWARTTSEPLHDVAARLGHAFADPRLLEQAVTHRSWCSEHPGEPSNERLEFLGDAVLGVVVTDQLFRDHPHLPEGQLAKTRAEVVSSAALAPMARQLGLGAALRLGRGEELSGGRDKASILADALEAVLGAIWLDGGLEAAAPVVRALVAPTLADAVAGPGGADFKTRLQEEAARRAESLPIYRIAEMGPDHAKVFDATVSVAGEIWGHGTGRSKKEAEQAAAANAWERMGGGGHDERPTGSGGGGVGSQGRERRRA
jgi:ribonuclease III